MDIINSCQIVDWRRYFIRYPETIKVCGLNKFIRHESDNDILLLERSQTNGTHKEYYSYALYLKLLEQGNEAFYIESNSIDYLKYISNVNGKKIMIFYGYTNSGWAYQIKKGDIENSFINEDDLIEYLKQIGFVDNIN